MNKTKFSEETVYGERPKLVRPRINLSRPESHEERIYCWHYWINVLLDPRTTGTVLQNLDYIPEFNGWGGGSSKPKFRKPDERTRDGRKIRKRIPYLMRN